MNSDWYFCESPGHIIDCNDFITASNILVQHRTNKSSCTRYCAVPVGAKTVTSFHFAEQGSQKMKRGSRQFLSQAKTAKEYHWLISSWLRSLPLLWRNFTVFVAIFLLFRAGTLLPLPAAPGVSGGSCFFPFTTVGPRLMGPRPQVNKTAKNKKMRWTVS